MHSVQHWVFSGLSPGFLSSGISLQATNDSMDDFDSSSSTNNLLISWANVLHKFTGAVPKAQVKILRQPSASRPDGPDLPFFNIEAFIIIDLFMSSYATGWTGLASLCIDTSGEDSLGFFWVQDVVVIVIPMFT